MRTIPRYIPKDSEPLEHPGGLGVVYLYGPARCRAIAYRGKAGRASWHYSFRDGERAEQHAREWFASLNGWEQRKAEWRADRNRPHTLKVGDVVYNSWGWEQTNIDWYQVVRTSRKRLSWPGRRSPSPAISFPRKSPSTRPQRTQPEPTSLLSMARARSGKARASIALGTPNGRNAR